MQSAADWRRSMCPTPRPTSSSNSPPSGKAKRSNPPWSPGGGGGGTPGLQLIGVNYAAPGKPSPGRLVRRCASQRAPSWGVQNQAAYYKVTIFFSPVPIFVLLTRNWFVRTNSYFQGPQHALQDSFLFLHALQDKWKDAELREDSHRQDYHP